MKETIGKGLVDAFSALDQNQSFNNVITAIGQLSTYIANVIVGIGVLTSKLIGFVKSIPGIGLLGKLFKFTLDSSIIGQLQKLGADYEAKKAANSKATTSQLAKTVILSKTQLITAKALTKEQKDQLALKQASLLLDQQNQIFNLDKIEIAAAMLNKQTAEDMARLTLKKDLLDLQAAINAGDAATATALAEVVKQDYARVQAYQALNIAAGIQAGLISDIKTAIDLIPFNKDIFNLDNIQQALNMVNQLISSMSNIQISAAGAPAGGSNYVNPLTMSNKPASVTTNDWSNIIKDLDNAAAEAASAPSAVQITDPKILANLSAIGGIPTPSPKAFGPGIPNVNITITDNAKKLVDVVMDTTQDQSASGIPTQITRNARNLTW